MKKKGIVFSLCLLLSVLFLQAHSIQNEQTFLQIFSVPSPTGFEHRIVSTIQSLLSPESTLERDSLGSLYIELGTGEEHVALLTGIDEIGYIVSGFDPRGYLNLDRVVSAATPLYDSFQFGHPVTVWTSGGPVAGVIALPSLHIVSREMRNNLQNVFSLENALVDIGVRSNQEAQEKGVEMLDPVTPLARITHLAGERKAGPSLGTKVCTSLLLDVALDLSQKTLRQKTSVVWMAQTKSPARGSRPRAALGAVLAKRNLTASHFLLLGLYPMDNQEENGVSLGAGPVLVTPGGNESELSKKMFDMAADLDIPLQNAQNFESMVLTPFLQEKNVAGICIPVRFSDSPNEVVDFNDVRSLRTLILSLFQ